MWENSQIWLSYSIYLPLSSFAIGRIQVVWNKHPLEAYSMTVYQCVQALQAVYHRSCIDQSTPYVFQYLPVICPSDARMDSYSICLT